MMDEGFSHNVYATVYSCVKEMYFNFPGLLEEERKENKQQADESAKQIKLLQGTSMCLWGGQFCPS